LDFILPKHLGVSDAEGVLAAFFGQPVASDR